MEFLVSIASVTIFPLAFFALLILKRSVFGAQAAIRLTALSAIGLTFHHGMSPFAIHTDAAYYLALGSEIHTGNLGLAAILEDQKRLWPALIAPLYHFEWFDTVALVIGVSATLLTFASLEVLRFGRVYGLKGVSVLEPIMFSFSLPVLVFGPSPLREALFLSCGVVLGISAYELATRGINLPCFLRILIGVIFAGFARIEISAVLASWVFIIFLLASSKLSGLRIRLYQLALLVVTCLSVSYFSYILFLGGSPSTAVLSDLLVDMQTSGEAVSGFSEVEDLALLPRVLLSAAGFFFGFYSPAAGIQFNIFAFLSWLAWLTVVVGVAFQFGATGGHLSRFLRVLYLIGPSLVTLEIILAIDNLGTLIRLKTVVVALLIPLSIQGWNHFFSSSYFAGTFSRRFPVFLRKLDD